MIVPLLCTGETVLQILCSVLGASLSLQENIELLGHVQRRAAKVAEGLENKTEK